MSTESPIFRPATPEDAHFIAHYVLAALHFIELETPLSPQQQQMVEALVPVAQQKGMLYSYLHAEIAQFNDQPIALLLRYEGQNFREYRERTFAQLPFYTAEELAAMDDETKAGELYIDSLAVHPTYRGRGIAQSLLSRAVSRAKELQLSATLLVDPDNPKARALYERCGFRGDGRINAFGVNYHRMVHQ